MKIPKIHTPRPIYIRPMNVVRSEAEESDSVPTFVVEDGTIIEESEMKRLDLEMELADVLETHRNILSLTKGNIAKLERLLREAESS